MADNPIKHKEIIEPGNPFEQANKGIQEFTKYVDKLGKDLKKSASEWSKFAQSQNASTKTGQENLKKSAKATQELSMQDQELLKIKKQLEREQAKMALLDSKEYKALIKAKEATKAKNSELRKTAQAMVTGGKTTNTWSKALGSFAAKFNTIGNVAANALTAIVNGIKRSINQFISFEKIVKSNQLTSDKYDQTIGRLKGSFEALNRAIALGDFEGLAENMRNASDAAYEYILAMDTIGDTQNALNIQTERSKRVVKELQEIYNDTSQERQVRLDAALKAQKILNDLQVKQEDLAKRTLETELNRVKTTFNLNDEQLKLYQKFIENYGLLTDEQVTSLEKVESKRVEADNAQKSSFTTGILLAASQSENAKIGVDAINKQVDATNDYNKVASDLSKTLGVDVFPIMEAIIGSNDEQRKKIVQTTIAYDSQIATTQKLINANAAMIGSIKNMKDETGKGAMAIKDFATEEAGLSEQIDNDIFENLLSKTESTYEEKRKIIEDFSKWRTRLFEEDAKKEIETEKNKEAIKQQLLKESSDITASIFDLQYTRVRSQMEAELAAAGDNEAKKEQIRLKYARKEQEIAAKEAGIQGALVILNALLTKPFIPAGLIAAAGAAITTGIQIAAIKSTQFEEGGHGLLEGASHRNGGISLGAIGEAEHGEYFGIINKGMTRKYQNELPAIFDSINKGKFHDVFSRSNIMLNGDEIFKSKEAKKSNIEMVVKSGIDSLKNEIKKKPVPIINVNAAGMQVMEQRSRTLINRIDKYFKN